MIMSLCSVISINAEDVPADIAFKTSNALYAHAVSGSEDAEAWLQWQSAHDEDYNEIDPEDKYFFLPSSADADKVDIYNAFSGKVSVNGVEINPGEAACVPYEVDKDYTVEADEHAYTLCFLKSNAEAAIYVNNDDADGEGTDLITVLNDNKENSSKATGAIVTPDGKIDNTPVKKIKGRGNTTWMKAKKPYNITYDKKVSIAGMAASKKFSLLANYQDDSLSRNRFLYDLSDAVGLPYASDSRFVDFYANGYYWGSYQICEKIEVGSNSLVGDFEEDAYLNEDGTVKEDFPFLCEVDSGAKDGEDYYVKLSNGQKITIKAPELDDEDDGYEEVMSYVKSKFEAFYNAAKSKTADLSAYADVDSLAKIYLINELGKNWDSGVSSLYFTYHQDEEGVYKFSASPVWDYDNSLGNANGIANELKSIGVSDYTEPTGWWCKFKGTNSGSKTSSNIMNRFAQNTPLLNRAKEIWKEEFIPALKHFSGEAFNETVNADFYTAENYFSLIEKSAEMNYISGWLLDTGNWIADHSSLVKATFDSETNTYYVNKYPTSYPETFGGMYDYCRDWMLARAAWMSKEMAGTGVKVEVVDNGEEIVTEPASEETQPVTDATQSEKDETQPVTDETQPVTNETQPVTVQPEPDETAAPTEAPTQAVTAGPATAPSADKTVSKQANPVKVKAKTCKVKAKSLKKKAVKIKIKKLLKITGAQGKITYAKVKKGTAKAIYKKIKINKKNGKITLKKGKYKKKTYKVKIKIVVAGNDKYSAKTLTATAKIKIK
jgi:hypothetical protein